MLKNPAIISKRIYNKYFQRRDLNKALNFISKSKWSDSVLKTEEEVHESIKNIKKLNLLPHHDKSKNWDCFKAFSFILNFAENNSKILDIGSGAQAEILEWLRLFGFRNLIACDIRYKGDFKKRKIQYYKRNLINTKFPKNYFDYITSISVIEHGVEIDAYLNEMNRILKSGGYLITSTDYWPDPIDTSGIFPYGKEFGEMKIFTHKEIEDIINLANKYDFKLAVPIDYTYKDKVVNWERTNRQLTFIFFVLQKK